MIARLCASLITGIARIITGVRAEWRGCAPEPRQRVYFVNHASHGDFVLVWCVLPPSLRAVTRPVAGADYWLKGPIRRFIGRNVFHSIFVDRNKETRTEDPVALMSAALDEGSSIIIFPEGTRNTSRERLLPFKSGLYHLAKARPQAELIPVWIENLNRVMPKGEIVPIPLLCTVAFGPPIQLGDKEDKNAFIERARAALLGLAPENRT